MSITIKFYGDLRQKVPTEKKYNGIPSTLNIDIDKATLSVFDILKKFDIKEDEISHIFVNGKYCGPGKQIKDGDRIGLFPRRMGLIFLEIPQSHSIQATVKLFANLRQYSQAISNLYLPEGSTIESVIRKLRIPKDIGKLIIIVNGKPCYDKTLVIKNNDTLAIFPPLAGG